MLATTVLVVEDDPRVARAFCRSLRAGGYGAHTVGTLAEARARIAAAWNGRGAPYAAVVIDLKLPDGDGEDLVTELEELRPPPAVAVVSGTVDGERAFRMLARGVWVIPKPVAGHVLLSLMERLCAGAGRIDVVDAFCDAHKLSPTETRLVRASAEGLRTADAADLLGCSVGTATTHWKHIFEKTGRRSQSGVLSALVQFSLRYPPLAGGSSS